MAKLYFKYGAMGSSKTATALITKYNYEERGMKVWLIKPAADQRDARGQVVRGSERALSDQSVACSDASGHRVDFRRLERLVERHRRHDRRQPPDEHRFARARRTDHQHVVASGRGDFERSLGDPLSLDVAEIGFVGSALL